jgi:hypothetical protein
MGLADSDLRSTGGGSRKDAETGNRRQIDWDAMGLADLLDVVGDDRRQSMERKWGTMTRCNKFNRR